MVFNGEDTFYLKFYVKEKKWRLLNDHTASLEITLNV